MFGLVLSVMTVVGTMILGVVLHKIGYRGSRRMFACVAVVSFCLILAGAVVTLATSPAGAAEAEVGATGGADNGLAYVGMALATGLACIGAGVAVGGVGSAALGLVGEKPEAMGTTFIYLGLAEGVAIYGIVISILIFSRLG
ncbi:MAG: ATP synthase subunit C [Synergistaceae bacterium]|nr:ATP synthase subunit C [Synergistaceae bacterium]